MNKKRYRITFRIEHRVKINKNDIVNFTNDYIGDFEDRTKAEETMTNLSIKNNTSQIRLVEL